jgi:hypothetical protein
MDEASWPAAFADGIDTSDVVEFVDSEGAWSFNGNNDPAAIFDPEGGFVDMLYGESAGHVRREADGSSAEYSSTLGAVGALDLTGVIASPIYVYEMGEDDASHTDFAANYAMVYVQGYP